MKRLCLLLVLVLMGVSAYAQTTQGKSSVGFNVGYGFIIVIALPMRCVWHPL